MARSPLTYVHPTPDTAWVAHDQALDDLEWRLRYDEGAGFAEFLRDALLAATVISEFRAFVRMTEAQRRPVTRAIRVGGRRRG